MNKSINLYFQNIIINKYISYEYLKSILNTHIYIYIYIYIYIQFYILKIITFVFLFRVFSSYKLIKIKI